ncbi:hypothetical protein PC9H_002519 [Pleurotus ostreatus]|uniref:F-box domain-containing protein n=1 Tax=Pleurotus ostreatus TaxID=5322 RepID=A0A8H6ZJ50_PLEOS|nr:uncharacterized protein PC9H_002519 [Pleurotus ostreatus]KAF7416254.1 hypothetical protein PC9H_002519 [Pleurotus ostreatus]KAJ8689122.1 hypothetical protein PTI98_013177 [Pleurotus ostreatus]
MKQLPNEMVRQMAGILRDASDFPTLLECSLVCHVWNDIFRPYTVHTVVVRAQNFYTRLEFLNFTAPHLSKHIVELTLQWDDCILDTPEWIPGCLLRLHGLRALRLKNYRAAPPPMVPAPFALGILSLIAAVPLKALYLESWSFLEDASDLLRILSCCSGSLEDLFIQKTAYDHGTIADDGGTVLGGGTVLSTVCLESLRILRLFEWIGSAPLPTTELLQCPNLERLEITRTHAGPWDIPSWIPAGLSELVLQVEPGTWMPGLGSSIRPSRLTIDITNQGYSIATYLEVMEWVEDCIDHHIPFPDLLRYLTVKINTYPRSLGPHHSPELEDYVAMSAALQQIHERLNLERITVNIVYTTDEGDTRIDGPLELTKLDVAFSQLVDTGLFYVTFEWSDGHERTLLQHVFQHLELHMAA